MVIRRRVCALWLGRRLVDVRGLGERALGHCMAVDTWSRARLALGEAAAAVVEPRWIRGAELLFLSY